MKKYLVWASIIILGLTLLMGAGCTKKPVGTPEGEAGAQTDQPLSTTDMMTEEDKERQRQIEAAEAASAQAKLEQEAALNEQIAREQEAKLKDAFVNQDIYNAHLHRTRPDRPPSKNPAAFGIDLHVESVPAVDLDAVVVEDAHSVPAV